MINQATEKKDRKKSEKKGHPFFSVGIFMGVLFFLAGTLSTGSIAGIALKRREPQRHEDTTFFRGLPELRLAGK